MLLTALVALAMVSTPEKLFEGIDPAWSPDGAHVACLTPFGREIQIYTLDGKLVSSIESKRGDKWLEIDSFAWFPDGQEILICEQETNARIGGDEFVKSQLLRAPLDGHKFTVVTTDELDGSAMSSTTHVFKSLRFATGATQALAVKQQYRPIGSREISETLPAMIDLTKETVIDWRAITDLKEFHVLQQENIQMVLTYARLEVFAQEDDTAFSFKMDFVGGFDFSRKAGVVCWTGNNSVMFRKLKSSMIIEYHMPRDLYGLGRIMLSPDAKRVVFSAYQETDILRPENDKSNVYVMDVPVELTRN